MSVISNRDKDLQVNEAYVFKVADYMKALLRKPTRKNVLVGDGEILPIITYSWREL